MSILLLHGFTGTPCDLEPLAKELTLAGFMCTTPELPGHNRGAHLLKYVSYAQWLNTAREALGNSQTIIGLSMGALLATILAAESPEKVKSLVLLSPAYQLSLKGRLGELCARLGLYHIMPNVDTGTKIIPLRAIGEFDALRRLALTQVNLIHCPIFAAFGEQDQTIDVAASKKVLGNSDCEIHIYRRSGHVLPLDLDRKKLFTQTIDFCRDHR